MKLSDNFNVKYKSSVIRRRGRTGHGGRGSGHGFRRGHGGAARLRGAGGGRGRGRGHGRVLERRVRVRLVMVRRPAAAALPLQSLLQVHLGVPLLLVRPRELPTTYITRKRFFTSMGAHVRRQVI